MWSRHFFPFGNITKLSKYIFKFEKRNTDIYLFKKVAVKTYLA